MAAMGIGRIKPGIALSLASALFLSSAPAHAQNAGDPGAAQTAQQQHDQQVAGISVAERLVAIAQENLLGPANEDALRQSEALIEAATRLVPKEPRYFRLLAAARMQLHDVPGEIAAWSAYRQLRPDDRVAQVRIINLYATQMQTADQREKYLGSLLDREGIPNEVKSAVATEAAKLLLNRSASEASAMIDRAVKFYPLPEAVMLQYQLLDKKAAPVARLKGLLAILRSDPIEVDALSATAELLSGEQLNEQAKAFYSAAVDALQRDGVAPPHSLLMDYVACLYLSGSDALAKQWASSVLHGQPTDVDFQFLNLTILKTGSDPSPDDALSAARDALAMRWTQVNNAILGLPQQQPDAGQPVMPPDPTDAANKLAHMQASPQTQQLKDAFVSSMVDLAWLEIYYANKPQDAQRWIDALKVVVPAGTPALERLEGWADLKTQKFEEAAQHFNVIKGNDVLTELGLIIAARSEGTPKTVQRAVELKQKLLSTHYDGLLDAIVHEALAPTAQIQLPSDLPAPPRPANQPTPATKPATQPGEDRSADAAAMTDALKQFPPNLLNFSGQPERFYTVHLTPLTTSCQYAQPIMAVLSVTNVGDFDLPIDSLGPVLPSAVYSAEVMGANLGPSPAYATLTGRLVLHPNEEMDEVVRLDQGALAQYLEATITPGLALITGDAYTNPVIGNTKVTSGAGGQRAGTSQLIGRQVPDLMNSSARGQFYTDLQAGPPDVRIQSLDLLWANSRWLHKHTQKQSDLQLSDEFKTVIDHYSADPVSVVADWARYRAATLPRTDGDKLIHALMTDKDWLPRLLSLIAMSNEPYPIRRQMTAAMVKDSDATVKALADSTLARLTAAASQPAAPSDETGAETQPARLPESP